MCVQILARVCMNSRWRDNRNMDTQTKTQDVGQQLQDAVLQAAFDAATDHPVSDQPVIKKAESVGKRPVVSPKNGAALPPGKGRPPGVRNKLTNLRDAVIEAFDRVGGADYLVRLAEGTQSDRAAFVSLMNKVLPTQVNANVDGGIKLELSWLSARNIGTPMAQLPEQRSQVIDLERDSEGGYRIKHPSDTGQGESTGPERDPLPPQDRQAGA